MKGFREYLKEFERDIVEQGIKQGLFTKKVNVSVANGKLWNSVFGKKLGLCVDSTEVFVIDYYGYAKKSKGLQELIDHTRIQLKNPRQLRMVTDVCVVHFASVKMEDIFTLNKELMSQFPAFKKELLKTRGFIK